jgi:hypothetical protein
MSAHRIASPREPGIMLQTVGRAHVAAVCRIIVHTGLRVESVGGGSSIVKAETASVVRVAIYSGLALANGWEPFNQPIPAAYMPLAFDAFDRISLDETGAELLVQSRPHNEQLRAIVVNDDRRRACEFLPLLEADELAAYLLEKLKVHGLPTSVERVCAERLRSSCAGLLAAAA